MDDSPRIARLRKLHTSRMRIERQIEEAVLDAVDAGDDQTQIAASIHRSREYLRLMVKRLRRES